MNADIDGKRRIRDSGIEEINSSKHTGWRVCILGENMRLLEVGISSLAIDTYYSALCYTINSLAFAGANRDDIASPSASPSRSKDLLARVKLYLLDAVLLNHLNHHTLEVDW